MSDKIKMREGVNKTLPRLLEMKTKQKVKSNTFTERRDEVLFTFRTAVEQREWSRLWERSHE